MAIINRETDYAIRILRSLKDGEVKSVPAICKEQSFANTFAYKIIKKLEKSGFVDIVRGKQGGVRKLPDTMDKSLYDLMNALDNIQYVNDCFKNGYCCEYANGRICDAHNKMAELQNNIDMQLKQFTLGELIC